MPRVADALNPDRSAWETTTGVCVGHAGTSRTWDVVCTPGTVVAVSADFVVVRTEATVNVVFYTLSHVEEEPIWTHNDPETMVFGRFHESIPSLLVLWVESTAFRGVCLVPHLGITHTSCIAPLFYPVDGACPLNAAVLDSHLLSPVFGSAERDPPAHTSAARAYACHDDPSSAGVATACCWREFATTVSGVLLTPSGATSFSVPFDDRLGYTNVHAGVGVPVLSLATLVGAKGATSMSFFGVGAVETISLCNGEAVVITDFYEPVDEELEIGDPFTGTKNATVQVIRLDAGEHPWTVTHQGGALTATSVDGTRLLRPACSPTPA